MYWFNSTFQYKFKSFSLEDEDIYEGIYIDNKLKDKIIVFIGSDKCYVDGFLTE